MNTTPLTPDYLKELDRRASPLIPSQGDDGMPPGLTTIPNMQFRSAESFPRRIVFVGSVIYQSFAGGEATTATIRYSRDLGLGDEQEYSRRLKAGPEWSKLDCGWVKEAAALIIDNQEGVGLAVNPSPEEEQGIASRTILIGVGSGSGANLVIPFGIIRPGEQAPFTPPDLRNLYVRCLSPDGAKFTLNVFPA